MFRRYLLPRLTWIFYRLLIMTWRITVSYHPKAEALLKSPETAIIAHWHGDELAILHLVKPLRIATMTSTSKDGSLINFVIQKLGGATSRGSSTRGGASALRGLVRLCRLGFRASMAVDGPKGPLHQVKPGVFELAKLINGDIVPLGASAHPKYVFKRSWNQAILPLFFAKVVIYFGEPIHLPFNDGPFDPRNPEWAHQLHDALSDAARQSANLIAS